MKKLTLIAFAILGSLCGHSQNIEYPKNQVSAFYCNGKSLYSGYDKFLGNREPADGYKGDGTEQWDYTNFSGTYNIEYLHNFIQPWMSLGVQIGYEENCSKHWIYRYRSIDEKSSDHWTEKDRMPYILCVMQFDLLRSNWMGIYTKAGEGVRFVFTDKKYESGKTDNNFKYGFCFVGATGIEVGPKFVRFFGELGIGAQGFASIGIRGRF
ncbi:MAG: hypothetical protein IKW77_06755 [Salinivirgaceae bacterium]|nr:hypothetical protein [Salinivirgaceae bacterium]